MMNQEGLEIGTVYFKVYPSLCFEDLEKLQDISGQQASRLRTEHKHS